MQAYLETFSDPERAKAVAMDMHQPFREAVQMCLPRAKVVADKFHVIRHLNGIVDAVRAILFSAHDCIIHSQFADLSEDDLYRTYSGHSFLCL